ncbi:hypothetical protein OG756_06650 [Streptomyces sp. NBC_01310]|uniref:DUF6213 family protein n=1 Tax=Streptomyces sp. NBC_01310 TaxID=2903820 RepID=UPI003F4B03CD|nr:hypothetical protein OG756_06650 [Streptomyces sp. NBC_01310]
MISVSISLIPTADGQMLIPATEVTSLLRCLAADWLGSPPSGEEPDIPAAVDEAAGAMNQLADQIDAECIACASEPGTGRPEGL